MVSTVVAPIPPAARQGEDAAGVPVRTFVADPGLHFVLPDRADRARLCCYLYLEAPAAGKIRDYERRRWFRRRRDRRA